MSETAEEEADDFDSYKHLSQFYNIVQRNRCTEDRCIDKERLVWRLETIMSKSGDISYPFPNRDFVTLRNPGLVGCTALHLSVGRNYCDPRDRYMAVVKTLLKRGIDFTVKNCNDSTALHTIVDSHYHDYRRRWRMKGRLNDPIVDVILSAHMEFKVAENPRDGNGVSHFHVACMANHSSAVEFFLKAGVSVDEVVASETSVFPGYTPLHLAVRCCALETVELLMKHGADVNSKEEANGMTPIELLLEQNMAIVDLINTVDNVDSGWRYRVEKLIVDVEVNKKIMELLLLHIDRLEYPLIFDSTGLSLFHLACTLDNTTLLEKLLSRVEDVDHCVKMDSPFWPGYTALHFAAHFDVKIVKLLLQRGANIDAKDANGLTPFDICVERYKPEDLRFILESNPVCKDILLTDDETRLSEIVGAMRDSDALNDFLKDRGEVLRVPNDSPLWPGYTPLHLALNITETMNIITDYDGKPYYSCEDFDALEREYLKRIEVCLKHNRDLTVQDARGSTALHLAYRLQKPKAVNLLLREYAQSANPIDADNLSHLYVACAFDYPRVVERLLASDKSAVKVQIKSTFRWPRNQRYFVRTNRSGSPFFVIDGSTAVQVAGKSKLLMTLLDHGADRSAKDPSDVTTQYPGLVGEILWKIGDVEEYTSNGLGYLDLMDPERKKPSTGREDWDLVSSHSSYMYLPSTALLPKSLEGVDVNSTDSNGVSHFHVACLRCELDIMEKFLKCGVDANRPVALLSSTYAGYTPLHLVLDSSSKVDIDTRIKAIDLLVSHGVNVQAGDLFDNTTFHAVIKWWQPRGRMFEKLLSIGTNIRLKNVFGEEPLGMLLRARQFEADDVELFTRHGCHLNIFEPMRDEGCLTRCFSKDHATFKRMLRLPGITKVDELGRNAIHNIVSGYWRYHLNYTESIRRLLEKGCDIDLRDHSGKTPLRRALDFSNYKAVVRLLEAGADVNVTDARGFTTFSHAFSFSKSLERQQFEYEYGSTLQPMAMHIRKLQIVGLHVSEQNAETLVEWMEEWPLDEAKIERAKADLKKMKDMRIESTSLSPYDFFSETGAVAAFPHLSWTEQQAVNQFFKYVRKSQFKQLAYLLKLRHKKALERVSLMEPARVGLNLLLKVTLPEKCSRRILRFLSNADLVNLTATLH